VTAAPGAPAPPPTAGAPALGPAPALAAELFGDRLPLLQAYAEVLATWGVERGLLGPREAPRLWERHLLNSVGLAELLPTGARVADLGSGAGLPGLVLAIARPDLSLVLVEPLLRRSTFLLEVVSVLGLPNVDVRRARAEELTSELIVDAVVARAVAALPVLAGWALPLLRPGGRLLALKGDRAASELAEARPGLGGLAVVDDETPQCVEVGGQDQPTWARVVIVERSDLPLGPGGVVARASARGVRPSARAAGPSAGARRIAPGGGRASDGRTSDGRTSTAKGQSRKRPGPSTPTRTT
jgi:16S rRNA (guanine527-N7)-methyltransferase